MENEYLANLQVERKFEVYDIKWVIEDFSLATCSDNWSIQSPEFTIRGFHVTKWLIILAPASNMHQSDFFEFTLKRCDSDAGPETMFVEWRLSICVSDFNKDISLERFCDFNVGAEYKEILKSLKNSIETIKSFESDQMTVRCKMIVHNKAANEEFEPCHDRGMSCLSESLLNLFLSSRDCDLELKIGDKAIMAHKAIACTRIEELTRSLEEADTGARRDIDVIDLSGLNYEAMVKIMEYVYSGNLMHVLGEPSLAIHSNVIALDMHHLKKCYTPKKLTFRTSLNAQEARFTWVIEDFIEKYDDLLISPDFSVDYSTTWRLHFFPGFKKYSDYFSIHAESVRGAKLGNLFIEFAITDDYGDTIFAKRLRRATNDLRSLRFDKFIRRSLLRSFLVDSTLRLTMKFKQSRDPVCSYIVKQDISVVTSSHTIGSFELLSQNMHDLLEYSDFCDVLLHNNFTSFMVHRSIITSRCSFLSTLFSNTQDDRYDDRYDCIDVPDIEQNILYLLLSYIYAGGVPTAANSRTLTALREAAITFDLSLLADLCEEALEKKLLFKEL